MAEDFSDLKSLAEMAVEYLDLLVDSIKKVIEIQEKNSTELKNAAEQIAKNTQATEDSTKAKKQEKETIDKTKNALKNLGKEILNIANAGVKFGSSIGTSATKGVEAELRNRVALLSQIKLVGSGFADLAVTMEQQKAAQQGLTDAFISVREGSQISAQGSIEFVQSLKKGFKSEFEPTADTFRMLTQMGMSTTEQFDSFRRATGRASLSNNQLATLYNKNTLSFLLYGNKFAAAAVQAERLGVNLASVQAAQEGLVTNLDGTIDTVAQLNQLGSNIDFGSLVRLSETEGPDALMAYIRQTVPEQMMQSASTRALFKQLGISVEDYMKSGNKQMSAADQLEAKMTEAATQTGKGTQAIAKFGAFISKAASVLTGSFWALSVSAWIAAKSLIKLGGGFGEVAKNMGTAFSGMTAGRGLMAAGLGMGLGVGAGTAMGGTATGSTVGSIIGMILGAAVGSLTANPAGVYAGMSIGGALGGAAGGYLTKTNDMYSAGYGSRVLVTPSGAFSLNNADDIIAGTNLFPKGALQMGSDNSGLMNRIDSLIDTINNASTVINVGGTTQTVPRLRLAQVYSRNEAV